MRELKIRQYADWFVRALAVLSIMAVLWLAADTRDRAACQAQYNEVANERTRVLAESTDEERAASRKADDALTALLLDPVTSKPVEERTPAEKVRMVKLFQKLQTALREQSDSRSDADQVRATHPVPQPPSSFCR